jgi:hypothetical protein
MGPPANGSGHERTDTVEDRVAYTGSAQKMIQPTLVGGTKKKVDRDKCATGKWQREEKSEGMEANSQRWQIRQEGGGEASG